MATATNPNDDDLAIKPSDELLAQLTKYVDDWHDATVKDRQASERDRDYYDNIQITPEEMKELEDRGQPALAFNQIAPKLNYMFGDEILKRVDPKAYPRTPSHEDAAEAATDMLRYIDEQQRFDSLRSLVYENMLIEGAGGAVVEIEKTPRVVPIGGMFAVAPVKSGVVIESASASKIDVDIDVVLRLVPWDRLFWDPHSRAHDFSDALYKGIVTWYDRSDALDEFPDAADIIDNTHEPSYDSTTADRPARWSDDQRKRIRIDQIYWWRRRQCYTAKLTGGGFVEAPKLTGFLDDKGRNECPLIMTSCFITRQNQRYGVVRSMIAPQDEINKRRSKALHRLNTKQVITERGIVHDVESARVELAKPDGWIELNEGRSLASMQISTGMDIVQTELNMVEMAKREIDSVGTLGQVMMDPSASGVAQRIRQKAASVPLEKVMDHLRSWTKAMYVAMWHRVRQFQTDEKWLRITDDADKKGYRFVGVNRLMTRAERLRELLEKQVPMQSALSMLGSPSVEGTYGQIVAVIGQQVQQSGQQVPPQAVEQMAMQQLTASPVMREHLTVNALDQLDVDIIIEEAPDTTIIQQEEFETLGTAVQTVGPLLPPPVAQKMLEMLFEASSLRTKKKILEVFRKPPENNPQAMQAAQLQLAEKQQDVRRTASQADLAAAQAQKTQAETQLLPAHAAVAQANAQATAAKTQAEVQAMPAKMMRDQAAAMNDAANAGAATMPMQGGYRYG